MIIEFFVPGCPKPGGSKRAFVVKGRAIVTEDCKDSKPWRSDVRNEAQKVHAGPPLSGPLGLEIEFTFARPKSHYKANGALKPNAPRYHTIRPDTTKLIRSLEDSIKGVVWLDDSQVCTQRCWKRYGDRPGALVRIVEIGGDDD